MSWKDHYIAVDWGTTNRRAWLVDTSGEIAAEFADDRGVMAIVDRGFDAAVVEIRQRLGDWPMLLAGMIGSDKGWRRAPYARCPASAANLARDILWVDPNYTGIVPGVCQIEGHADVMRGEEVQAIGAVAAQLVSPNAYICHPGTHSKWIRMHDGEISGFRTMMTGEIFNLLRTVSVLSSQMQDEVTDGSSFVAGLEQARNGNALASALFAVRAEHLLLEKPVADVSYASGVLIGSDVDAGLEDALPGETIAVVGRSDLCQLYARAIEIAGFECRIVGGDEAFLAGMNEISRHIEVAVQH